MELFSQTDIFIMTKLSEGTIVRFLSSQCTDIELDEINRWISESPDNAKLLFELERIHTLSCDAYDRTNTADAFAKLSRRIAIEEGVSNARRRNRMRLWGSIAAAAVIVLLVTIAIPFTRTQAIPMIKVTAAASPVETTLPDGSHVWLNKYTTIEYPEQFAENRNVKLHGEAYFEVKHDTSHPFTVDGNYIDVTVLGTKFTFRSNSGNAFSFVSLVEGSVKVNETEGEGCVVLNPGQKATYDPTCKLLTVNDTETPLDAVWHDNNIPFHNATIRQIASALEQLYGMKVHVNDNVSSNATYSGAAMRYDSIDTTLSNLAHTLPIIYTIQNGEVWISAKRE